MARQAQAEEHAQASLGFCACMVCWCAEIFSRTYNAKTQRTGLERLTGDTSDISEWLDFNMYNQVWVWDSPGKEENPRPGGWLGVSHCIGSMLCSWVINGKGTIYSRTMVQHVTTQDMKSNDIHHQFESLDAAPIEWLDDENFVSVGQPDMLYEEDMEVDYVDSPEPYDLTAVAGDIEEGANIYDEYLGAELYFDISPNGGLRKGTHINLVSNSLTVWKRLTSSMNRTGMTIGRSPLKRRCHEFESILKNGLEAQLRMKLRKSSLYIKK